jgi:probable HAF family extracellular repeat protein
MDATKVAQTKVTQTPSLAGFSPSGNPGCSYRRLLPILVLRSVTAAWSRPQVDPPGPQVPKEMEGQIQPAQPGRVSPDPRNGLQMAQTARARAMTQAAVSQPQAAAATPTSAQYLFVNINIPNSTYVQPNAVNNAGLVAGWYLDAAGTPHGFLWQNGGVQTLDYPGSTGTYLNGTNNRGVLIGYYFDASYNSHAATYSLMHSSWSVLPDIPNNPQGQGYGINDGGVAVGYAYSSVGPLAWVWHPDSQSYSFFTAPAAAEANTFPLAINDEGQALGYQNTVPGSTLGFVKDDEGLFKNFSVPGSIYTIPSGINNRGMIAGWFFTSTFANFGFIRNNGGAFTTVNYPGFAGTSLSGINDLGVICGYSLNATTFQTQAFVAYPQ